MAMQMLLIFAHPDDESFALGGTIAKYAEQGVNITLVAATKGEAGKAAGICKLEDLGAIREQELHSAAGILGISKVVFLGYRDKEVPIAPPLEIVEKLVRIIRGVRPQVIITFGADGASGHRDHRAIHHFTQTAIQFAKAPIELDLGKPFTLPRLCYVRPAWRLSADKLQDVDYTISISPWAERKWQAILEHKTQQGSRKRFEGLEEKQKQDYLSQEYFQCDQTFSAFPGKGQDLFQDLERVEA
ncbi:MAG TPA: PIG-L family deacetylase [Desulfosporosinus sp.]|jgi:LmbE family N-acetylglucosaminyl deacetylase|nr:PIG-L family deacetylase [Desulfosporosinus sp.]